MNDIDNLYQFNRVKDGVTFIYYSSHYRDFANPKKRESAKYSYTEVAKKIRNMFDEYIPLVISDPFVRKKYFSTSKLCAWYSIPLNEYFQICDALY